MRSQAVNVDRYLEELPAERRQAIAALRQMIRAEAPEARETMQYGLPTYTLRGEPLYALASQKNYLALYVSQTDLVADYQARLGKIDCGKSCIRFKRLEDLCLESVSELLAAAHRQVASLRGGG